MSPVLMDVVLEFLLFLQLADDDDLDPDVAVEQLEWVTWTLDNLGPGDRAELTRYAAKRANMEARYPGLGEARADLLRSLAEHLGWAEEPGG